MTIRRIALLILPLLLALSMTACRKKTPEDMLKDAMKAQQRGDMIGAIVKCKDIIEKAPKDPAAQKARMLLAYSYNQNRDFESARKVLSDIIANAGMKSDEGKGAYMNRLKTWESEGKLSDAIKEIQATSETLKVDPEFDQAVQIHLGQLYFQNKQPKEAKDLYLKMIASAKDEKSSMRAIDAYASVLINEKNYKDAAAAYQQQLDKYPNTEEKGILLYAIGAMHKSIADASKDPAEQEAEKKAADDTWQSSVDFMKARIDKELVNDKKMQLLEQLCQVYIQKGSPDQGLQYLDEFLTKNPTLPQEMKLGVFFQKAFIYVQSNQEQKAVDLLTTYIKDNSKDPSSLKAYQFLASVYAKKGDLRAAKKYLMEGVKAFPNDPDIPNLNRAIQGIDQQLSMPTTGTLRTMDGRSTMTAPATGATTGTIPTSATVESVTTSTAPTENTATSGTAESK